jgi:dephospho-CoA kinase
LDPVTKSINRVHLSQVVFADRAKLGRLNRIMRWPIAKALLGQIFRAFFVERNRVVFLEAPLLFESGRNYPC